MKTFLDLVAQDLLERHNGDLQHVTIVFPGKRARLFMNESLLSLAEGPMWSPKYTSITQLFEQLSQATVSEPIPAVLRLYDIYSHLLGGNAESIDKFWGWGEIILSDFDDIDKHMVDADQLFRNALELKEMESDDFLTEEQRTALQQFFKSFSGDERTRLQQNFLQLWRIMPDMYHRLNTQNTIESETPVFPTEGAMQRYVVEHNELMHKLDGETEYCFVGFNMLSATERTLMKYLQKQGQARFYWDYDDYYVKNPNAEAGDFMRQNLRDFPLNLSNLSNQTSPSLFGERHDEALTYVASSTDSMATRYIPLWLKDNLTKMERETAIVLCDEKKLIPVLHSIPEDSPKDINITMGYPLNSSPIFTFMMALVALQTEGWDEKRKRFRYTFQKVVERHPLATQLQQETWLRRVDPSDAKALVEYLDECTLALFHESDEVLYTESIFLTHKALRQFADTIQELNPQTLRRLLRRMLASLSIPFHGEPAQGLQIMGMLETRCLDFRNILILNAEEGLLPAQQNDASLIPNTLRVGFGLTTVRHRTAVFAYYFYRLLQRAEKVTMVYNQTNSGITHHEMSRFLRQLQAETDIPIRIINLQAGQSVGHLEINDIDKTPQIIEQLHQMYDRNNADSHSLSPSAINVYLDCPMKFYLQQLCGLRTQDDPQDGIDARQMGIIIHDTVQEVYNDIARHFGVEDVNKLPGLEGFPVTAEHISVYTKDGAKALQPFIDEQFKKAAEITEFRGENVLIRNVVEQYIVNLLRWDSSLKKFQMLKMEDSAYMPIVVQLQDGTELKISTGGRIDRLDRVDNIVRVVDYKTGAHENAPKSLDELFTRNRSHAAYWLQTFLYCIAVRRQFGIKGTVQPILFYLAKAHVNSQKPSETSGNQKPSQSYDPTLVFNKDGKGEPVPVLDISDWTDEFISKLQELVKEIFNPQITFHKCQDQKTCEYCDFRALCGR